MENFFTINYTLRKLILNFNKEQFNFDLPIDEKSFYWNTFSTKNGDIWTIEFIQIDEKDSPKVNIYKNNEVTEELDILKNTNPLSFMIHLKKSIGDSELYFYTHK